MCNTYSSWLWTNNELHFVLALQCLSEDTVHMPLSQRDSPETVSDNNSIYWTNVMWGYIPKGLKIIVREDCWGFICVLRCLLSGFPQVTSIHHTNQQMAINKSNLITVKDHSLPLDVDRLLPVTSKRATDVSLSLESNSM